MAFYLRESDKHFLLSLFAATGIILFWKGVWEGIGALPLLEHAWVSLFVGLVMLTFSGLIFQQFDPLGGLEKATLKMLHQVHHHPQKHHFVLSYYDKVKRKNVRVSAKNISHIEKNSVSIKHKGKEMFLPIHRIKSVHKLGKVFWRQ